MRHSIFARFAILAGLGVIVPTTAAYSATASASIAVSVTVLSACAVVANPLAFLTYNPTSATATAVNTTIVVTCTTGVPFTVGLDHGANSASVTTRQMKNGSNALNYGLYQDSGHATNWGNTPGTDTPASTTATATPTTMTVYGLIPASQNVPAGVYTDTVQVTVNY